MSNEIFNQKILTENAVFEELEKIAQYDFSEQVNEHILGHIFEQSITDLEEIKSSLQNKKRRKTKKQEYFIRRNILLDILWERQ